MVLLGTEDIGKNKAQMLEMTFELFLLREMLKLLDLVKDNIH
jgi:hypothetical protein